MNFNLVSFSIIVCTHNGFSRLFETLEYLDKLTLNVYVDYEVIIVDNSSSKNSNSEIIQLLSGLERAEKFNLFNEPQKGKDFALILGVKKSKYNWIIVCDDDNWLSTDYLIIAASLICKYCDVVLFGSRSIPCFPNNSIVPAWFFENSLKYACGKQYENSGYVSYRQNLWGAGSVFRKDVLFRALSVSSILLSNMRGEDTEIFYRIIILGHKVYYSNELYLFHHITEDRLFLDNHFKMMFKDENSKIILNKYNQFIKYYFFNRKRILSIVKWNLVYMFNYLGIKSINNKEKARVMMSIFTPFIIDKDFKLIKKYYILTQLFRSQ